MFSSGRRWALAAAVGAALLAGLVWAGGAALAGRDVEAGVSALAAAEGMAVGRDRDARLQAAERRLSRVAAGARARDTAVWLALARVRYLQATGAAVGDVSMPLLAASAEAAARAQSLDPSDPAAPAAIAEALAALGERGPVLTDPLRRSYGLREVDPTFGLRRVVTALSVWELLDPDLRAFASHEACAVLRASPDGPAAVAAMAASARASPAAREAVTTIAGEARCAPTP